MTDLNAIELAIKTAFEQDSRQLFKKVDISKIPTSLSRPGFSVAVVSGADRSPVMDGSVVDETLKIIVTLVASNLASEEERRKIILPLVRYAQTLLVNKTLGINDIEPITPKGWTEVTTVTDMEKALIIVEVYFETSTEFSTEASDFHALDSIFNSMTSPDTGDVVLESDTVFNPSEDV